MKILKNDKVKILTGKDKGKDGKVIQILKDSNKLVVEGLNLMKKNIKTRDRGKEKGQIIELSAPINVSNVKLICPKCNKDARVGYQVLSENKVRVCKKCKEVI